MSGEATWYYSDGNDRKGPFTAAQIGALLSIRALGAHTRVWNERLAEWLPLYRTELRPLLGETPVEPPAAPAVAAAAPAAVLSATRGIGRAAQLACIAVGALCVARIAGVLNREGLQRKIEHIAVLEASTGSLIFYGVLGLIAITLFLIWKYRATCNLIMQHGPQPIGAGWAVGWYFIPLANLWKPFQAMRALITRYAAPDAGGAAIVWWAGFVLMVVFGFTTGLFFPDGPGPGDGHVFLALWLITATAEAVAYFALAGVIAEVTIGLNPPPRG